MSEEKQRCGYCGNEFLRVNAHLKYCKARIARDELDALPVKEQKPAPEPVKKLSWFGKLKAKWLARKAHKG